MIGFKYKMSNIQAAIGCAQVERINELTERKREIYSYYRDRMSLLSGIAINPEPVDMINGAWLPTLVFEPQVGITRETLQNAFSIEDIDSRVFFYPLSSLQMFEEKRENIVAWDLPNRAINLPSYHDISSAELDRVCRVIEKLVQK
jgi:perosamine synthetase